MHRRSEDVCTGNNAIGEEYNAVTNNLQYKAMREVHRAYEDIGIVVIAMIQPHQK